jgi:cobalt-zinc-cadmium efflux system membrane fusion protein
MSTSAQPSRKTVHPAHADRETEHEVAAEPAAADAGGFRGWLRRTLPTTGVVAALVALAVWGHSTEWTVPKFSELVGGEKKEAADWCDSHGVPESVCVGCNPSLVKSSTDFGWCSVHGVMQCPLEHPEIAQVKTPVAVTPAMLAQAQRAIAVRPRVENNSRCNMHRKYVQFASTESLEKVGVDIAIVGEKPILEAVAANGEIVYDETRMAHLSSRVAGTVWHVHRKVGDRVKKGDVLALVDAADVGRAKSEFVQAMTQMRLQQKNVERLRPLAGGVIPGKQLLEAQAAAEEARIQLHRAQQALANLGLPVDAEEFADLSGEQISQRMQTLGLTADVLADVDRSQQTSNLLPLRSPLDGVIVNRTAVEGEVVATNTALFDVADTSKLWLNLNVRQEDAKYVAHGQTVLFRASDSANEPADKGTVAWISTSADDVTRTVRVRVDLPNTDGQLRANTFGTGEIVLREEPKAIVVPSEAIHWDGTCNVVFVRDKDFFKPDAPKLFHVRSVRPGVKDGPNTEIIAGLLPGEVIASKNSVILEAQLLKSNLGAGCGCCEGKK